MSILYKYLIQNGVYIIYIHILPYMKHLPFRASFSVQSGRQIVVNGPTHPDRHNQYNIRMVYIYNLPAVWRVW